MAAPGQPVLATVELFGLLFGLTACILMKLHNTQPTPYMDELFHVRQTLKYCDGKFLEWDPMITTLPGLYIVSVALMNLLSLLFEYPLSVICDIFTMRCINLMFCMGNAVLVLLIYKQLHPPDTDDQTKHQWRVLFNAVTIAIFPPMYFYAFLYYTDLGSVFFVMLMYYLSIKDHHASSALCGLVAILFRQTNVIWVIFVTGERLVNILVERIQPEKKELTKDDTQSIRFIGIGIQVLFSHLSSFSKLKLLIIDIITKCLWFIVIGVVFLAFVVWNNGIVVGDRSAHQACLHFPQFLYFVAFTGVFAFMYHITPRKIINFVKSVFHRPFLFITVVSLFFVFVHFFTYEHPYLLADNRHYTFYIWARIFKRHNLVRYALVPGYVYAVYSLFELLSHRNSLWKLVFLICLLTSTVPQKLLEFRYFIMPYLIFRLNMRRGNIVQVLLEACLYIAVNSFTIYYFVEKSFSWPNSKDAQRFMW